ncbi:hypothetical protein SLEP1_g53152 [Rubroshorea leprosula]|uniref:Uncharacterized protein n=1 Tax=Rubroshorea leprosula TaxID=152421 RepID=A0AAV5M8P8_9ROSI|nr:hypothetical protein SLEP1_g53152 [Rubroshorea leprosula]
MSNPKTLTSLFSQMKRKKIEFCVTLLGLLKVLILFSRNSLSHSVSKKSVSHTVSSGWKFMAYLPKGCMTQENVLLVGSLFSRLISWDKSSLGGLESFLRLRVEIDVHVPLTSGFQFKQQGDEVCFVEFKHEKLVDFCYRPQYGPQLRAAAYTPRHHFGVLREDKKPHKPHAEVPAQKGAGLLEENLLGSIKVTEQSLVFSKADISKKQCDVQVEDDHAQD